MTRDEKKQLYFILFTLPLRYMYKKSYSSIAIKMPSSTPSRLWLTEGGPDRQTDRQTGRQTDREEALALRPASLVHQEVDERGPR